jgi:hypothetical protein
MRATAWTAWCRPSPRWRDRVRPGSASCGRRRMHRGHGSRAVRRNRPIRPSAAAGRAVCGGGQRGQALSQAALPGSRSCSVTSTRSLRTVQADCGSTQPGRETTDRDLPASGPVSPDSSPVISETSWRCGSRESLTSRPHAHEIRGKQSLRQPARIVSLCSLST